MNEYRIRINGEVVQEDDFRTRIHPTKMLPAILSPSMLDELGADAVLQAPAPTPGDSQVVVRNGVQQDALGNWVQRWEIRDIPQAQLDAERINAIEAGWNAIKAERDGPRVSGGVKVNGAWFHTDTDSRQRWMGFKDSARDILASGGNMSSPIMLKGRQAAWKTMGGAYAPITCQLAFDVVQAVKDLDTSLFTKAEEHHAGLIASAKPWEYNFLTGWPEKWPPGS